MADLRQSGSTVIYIDDNGNTLYTLPTEAGTNNQVITIDASGNLFFSDGVAGANIGQLANVDSSVDSATAGQVLSFDGTKYVAVDLSVGEVVIDSDYVAARQDFRYSSLLNTPNILDSSNVLSLIDADYVTSLGVVGTDSAQVVLIADDRISNAFGDATALTIGNWKISVVSDKLSFSYNDVVKASISSTGEIVSADDVTAFGAP